jgi:hypothetical protein
MTEEWGQNQLANTSPIPLRSNEDVTVLNLVSLLVSLNVLKSVYDAHHQRPLSKGLKKACQQDSLIVSVKRLYPFVRHGQTQIESLCAYPS